MAKLKYSQILNYILKILYDSKFSRPNKFLSLPSILEVLDYKVSFGEATEIADYLEAKGYVKVLKTIGDIPIQLTPIGVLYAEEELDESFHEEFTTYFKSLEKDFTFKSLYSDELLEPKNNVIVLVDKIRTGVIEHNGDDNDYVKNLEIIKIELSKNNPNYGIIEMKINELDNFGYVIGDLSELRDYILHAS